MGGEDNIVCDGDVCYRVPAGGDATAAATGGEGGKASVTGQALVDMLGATLLTRDGATVNTQSLIGPGKVVSLYFSAHWCPPCRAFTPWLAEYYQKFRKEHAHGQDWEVVFVSSDRDEAQWQEYKSSMPWLALPFKDRAIKQALSTKYKVQGIPSLVMVDAATGELITAQGRDAVMMDPEGKLFPWRPRSFSEIIPSQLVDKSGAQHQSSTALAGKAKMLYFSASWCPPCRRFTPALVKTYEALKAAGKQVEALFITSDNTEAEFKEYLGHMPWLAVPFSEADVRQELSSRYEVEGIPALVVLDENDKVVTTNGRAAVAADPTGTSFPWRLKPLEPINEYTVSLINDQTVLLLVLGGDSADAAGSRAQQLLGDLAPKAADKDVRCMWGLSSNELVQQVLEFAGVQAGGKELLVVLDVPKGQAAVHSSPSSSAVPLDAAAAQQFLEGYQSGKVPAKPLGE